MARTTAARGRTGARYSAPALDKGLDIIELLAGETDGLTQNQISQRLGRSVGELFRMLARLEERGYVHRRPGDGVYHLTLRLFELAHRFPPTNRLMVEALPVMRRLADETAHGCHLCVYQGGRLLVVAQVDSPGPMGFSVKVGGHFPLCDRTSGRVLAAFALADRRPAMLDELLAPRRAARERAVMARRLEAIRERGYEYAPSDTVDHVIDISFPILDHAGAAVAALTMPLLGQRDAPTDLVRIRGPMARAAAEISAAVGGVLGATVALTPEPARRAR